MVVGGVAGGDAGHAVGRRPAPPLSIAWRRCSRRGDGRWWLAAGVAAGLGLLSKYSALFLGAGHACSGCSWIARQRRWLASPWPYLGAVLALLIFAPNLVWQSQHHWETFAFQFGRRRRRPFHLALSGRISGRAVRPGHAADLCPDGGRACGAPHGAAMRPAGAGGADLDRHWPISWSMPCMTGCRATGPVSSIRRWRSWRRTPLRATALYGAWSSVCRGAAGGGCC